MLFDTHTHYDDEKFNDDRYDIIEKVFREGVSYILNAGCDIESSKASIDLSHKFENVYAAVGIHPHNVLKTKDEDIEEIKIMAVNKKVVAIGEIGLDYYYDFSPKDVQIKWFSRQINLAKELKLPVIVHNRDAHEDSLEAIKREHAKDVGGVFHCFTGSVEMAKELLKNNFYLSVGGSVTFKKARKAIEVVEYLPLDRIIIETDSPYLTPEPFRGKRNDSGFVHLVAEKIAQIKKIDYEVVARATTENAKRLFGIK